MLSWNDDDDDDDDDDEDEDEEEEEEDKIPIIVVSKLPTTQLKCLIWVIRRRMDFRATNSSNLVDVHHQVTAHPNILSRIGCNHFSTLALTNFLQLIQDASTGLAASNGRCFNEVVLYKPRWVFS